MLNRSLRRLLQITELIHQRLTITMHSEMKRIEWQTQQLASIILATSDVTAEGRRKIGSMIAGMSMLPDDDQTHEDTRSIEEIIEQGALPSAMNEPAVGSFERFVGSFRADPR